MKITAPFPRLRTLCSILIIIFVTSHLNGMLDVAEKELCEKFKPYTTIKDAHTELFNYSWAIQNDFCKKQEFHLFLINLAQAFTPFLELLHEEIDENYCIDKALDQAQDPDNQKYLIKAQQLKRSLYSSNPAYFIEQLATLLETYGLGTPFAVVDRLKKVASPIKEFVNQNNNQLTVIKAGTEQPGLMCLLVVMAHRKNILAPFVQEKYWDLRFHTLRILIESGAIRQNMQDEYIMILANYLMTHNQHGLVAWLTAHAPVNLHTFNTQKFFSDASYSSYKEYMHSFPLLLAAKQEHLNHYEPTLLDFFLEEERREYIDLNICNNKGLTALMQAAEVGNRLMVERLLAIAEVDRNITNKEGKTALMIAAEQGHADCLQLLLQPIDQAVINQQDNQGMTALMLAVKNKNHTCVKQLLAHTCTNIRLKDKLGRSALIFGLIHYDEHILQALLAYPENQKLFSDIPLLFEELTNHFDVEQTYLLRQTIIDLLSSSIISKTLCFNESLSKKMQLVAYDLILNAAYKCNSRYFKKLMNQLYPYDYINYKKNGIPLSIAFFDRLHTHRKTIESSCDALAELLKEELILKEHYDEQRFNGNCTPTVIYRQETAHLQEIEKQLPSLCRALDLWIQKGFLLPSAENNKISLINQLTPLTAAIILGHDTVIIKALLADNNLNCNHTYFENHYTLMMISIIAKYLNAHDRNSDTPLTLLYHYKKNINLLMRNCRGETASDLAHTLEHSGTWGPTKLQKKLKKLTQKQQELHAMHEKEEAQKKLIDEFSLLDIDPDEELINELQGD